MFGLSVHYLVPRYGLFYEGPLFDRGRLPLVRYTNIEHIPGTTGTWSFRTPTSFRNKIVLPRRGGDVTILAGTFYTTDQETPSSVVPGMCSMFV